MGTVTRRWGKVSLITAASKRAVTGAAVRSVSSMSDSQLGSSRCGRSGGNRRHNPRPGGPKPGLPRLAAGASATMPPPSRRGPLPCGQKPAKHGWRPGAASGRDERSARRWVGPVEWRVSRDGSDDASVGGIRTDAPLSGAALPRLDRGRAAMARECAELRRYGALSGVGIRWLQLIELRVGADGLVPAFFTNVEMHPVRADELLIRSVLDQAFASRRRRILPHVRHVRGVQFGDLCPLIVHHEADVVDATEIR